MTRSAVTLLSFAIVGPASAPTRDGMVQYVATDPQVRGAIGYGRDEPDALAMLEVVRADILSRHPHATPLDPWVLGEVLGPVRVESDLWQPVSA